MEFKELTNINPESLKVEYFLLLTVEYQLATLSHLKKMLQNPGLDTQSKQLIGSFLEAASADSRLPEVVKAKAIALVSFKE